MSPSSGLHKGFPNLALSILPRKCSEGISNHTIISSQIWEKQSSSQANTISKTYSFVTVIQQHNTRLWESMNNERIGTRLPQQARNQYQLLLGNLGGKNWQLPLLH
ncbi:hypothetical protein POPTR_018G105000v4 [Populus trichocarpa]|jgi:hypothetical protein|uniref:Uncharacterized protein n=1 Tax=Populus trichocarpa TaxID=3694 RepID=U5FI10_POPTR|nr:hypothetical protein POPTR_018G105000v4 [Populus trichocarpa]